mmetsp:Transcript_24684/g.38172  ORF Transcript_24684/g.38172 Transcript_24684/m.38172 type:complete len:276 (-) Transcript_24684:1177-2004(-)
MKVAPLPQAATRSMSIFLLISSGYNCCSIQLSIRERRKRGSRSTLIRTGTRNIYTITTITFSSTALSSRLVRMIVRMTTIGMGLVCVGDIFLLQITCDALSTSSLATLMIIRTATETTLTTIGIIAHSDRFSSSSGILDLLTSMGMILMRMLASHMPHHMSRIRRPALTRTGMSVRLTLMIGPLVQRMGMRHVMMLVRFMAVVGMVVLRGALASIVAVVGVSVFVRGVGGGARASLARRPLTAAACTADSGRCGYWYRYRWVGLTNLNGHTNSRR